MIMFHVNLQECSPHIDGGWDVQESFAPPKSWVWKNPQHKSAKILVQKIWESP